MAFARHEHPRRRLTADEVLRMVEAGVLGEDEPVQLLRGELIVMSPQSDAHSVLTVEIREQLGKCYGSGAHVRDHSPIRTDEHSLPEPDVAVVRGAPRDYYRRTPGGADTIVVVEIAYSSQAIDRAKAALYAAAGVPVYWLIDLPRRRVTVHEGPDGEEYRTIRTLDEDDVLAVPETDATWSVRAVLPPT
jgi:Uma2 family endonuclease